MTAQEFPLYRNMITYRTIVEKDDDVDTAREIFTGKCVFSWICRKGTICLIDKVGRATGIRQLLVHEHRGPQLCCTHWTQKGTHNWECEESEWGSYKDGQEARQLTFIGSKLCELEVGGRGTEAGWEASKYLVHWGKKDLFTCRINVASHCFTCHWVGHMFRIWILQWVDTCFINQE